MISLQLDLVQHDCPYVETTKRNDVSISAKQWNFRSATQRLETRILVEAADGTALNDSFDTLNDHGRSHSHELLERNQNAALIRSRVGRTNAMRVVRRHDGYLTGPFEVENGRKTWYVGFDHDETADAVLSELDRTNEVVVESRRTIGVEEYHELINNADRITSLLDALRDLSPAERKSIRSAVEHGYFETPRDATLSTIADELDVSRGAISKSLRRGQGKLLERAAPMIGELEGAEGR